LNKSLYGIKQDPITWYRRIDSHLINGGFNKSNSESTLYTKVNKQGRILIVCLYVDDMVFTENFSVDKFKATMKQEFEMTELGLMRYFLGIKFLQSCSKFFAFQERYAMDMLKRFMMKNYKPTPTPIATEKKLDKEDVGPNVDPTLFKRLVGSLMYLTATRPYIMHVVSFIFKFMKSPKDSHWQVGKRILRYITKIAGYDILYSNTSNDFFIGYTVIDFVGSLDDKKSTSRYVFHLGSGLISWTSKKHPIMTISRAEDEYKTTIAISCQ
jgi:hypothetical protein